MLTLSALTGEGVGDLLAQVAETVQGAVSEETLTLAFSEGRKRAWLFDQDVVQAERQTEDGFALDVRWTAIQKARFDGL